jgi:hypothetical protein
MVDSMEHVQSPAKVLQMAQGYVRREAGSISAPGLVPRVAHFDLLILLSTGKVYSRVVGGIGVKMAFVHTMRYAATSLALKLVTDVATCSSPRRRSVSTIISGPS